MKEQCKSWYVLHGICEHISIDSMQHPFNVFSIWIQCQPLFLLICYASALYFPLQEFNVHHKQRCAHTRHTQRERENRKPMEKYEKLRNFMWIQLKIQTMQFHCLTYCDVKMLSPAESTWKLLFNSKSISTQPFYQLHIQYYVFS